MYIGTFKGALTKQREERPKGSMGSKTFYYN